MLRRIWALGVDPEGDLIIPGGASQEDLVNEIARIIGKPYSIDGKGA
jgi:hypothetical protein